jgi:ribose transport system substrate-binding protein
MRLKVNRSRLFASVTAVGLVSALGACGSSDSGSGSASGAAKASTSQVAGAPSWCGNKKITLALADGFGDNNWRKVTAAEGRAEAAKCPSVSEFKYTDGQGNTQKSISDIKGLTAQRVDAMVVFPDQGKAVLPALRSAHKAGVITVPYRVSPGGTAGSDYDYYISTDFNQAGKLWGEWLIKNLPNGGNVANLGGPPANSQSQAEYDGMLATLKGHPNIKFIGTTPYNVTNWDAAKTQQVVTSLLARFPKIDAVTTDFGAAFASSTGAFKQAKRSIPAVATEDANELACTFADSKKVNPDFKLFTVDSQNWMVRTAVQFAVAKATGGKLPASPVVPQKAFEDSVSKTPNDVRCVRDLPGEAFISSHLSKAAQLAALK